MCRIFQNYFLVVNIETFDPEAKLKNHSDLNLKGCNGNFVLD